MTGTDRTADAEVLRVAAARVRAVGAKATKNVCPHWTWSAVRHIARNVDLECTKHDLVEPAVPEECESWGRYDDSPWFALVDARLAEPLAAWLEAAAAASDDDLNTTVDEHALAVARVLANAELPS